MDKKKLIKEAANRMADPNETRMLKRMAEFPATVLRDTPDEIDEVALEALEKLAGRSGPNPYSPHNSKMPESMKKTLDYFKSAEMTDYDDFDEAVKKLNTYTDKVEDLYPSMNKPSALTKLKNSASMLAESPVGKGTSKLMGVLGSAPAQAAMMMLEPSELEENEDDIISKLKEQGLQAESELEDPSNLMSDIEDYGKNSSQEDEDMKLKALQMLLGKK